jgi:sulfur-oxidizing protein SoxB
MITLPVLQAVTRRAALRGIVAVSASGLVPSGGAQAQDRYDVRELLRLEWPGQVSLLHIGPLQGELMPHYHRPSGDRIRGQDVEGLTGEALRVRYGIGGRNPMDYALTHEAFGELARIYGKMGGIDRMAAVLDGIRRQRPDALVLMGQGDETGPLDGFWGGAQSVSDAQNALRADVTLGAHAPSAQVFERGGERIAIIKHDRKGSVEALQQHVQDQKAAVVAIVVILSDVKLS